MKQVNRNIMHHYGNVWDIKEAYFITLEKEPMKIKYPDFTIMVIPPNEIRDMWTYASIGMSYSNTNPIELHLFSSKENDDLAEILTIVAYHKLTGGQLDLNDTVNFGKPLAKGSECNHGLISLPYLDGEKLERYVNQGKLVSFYWLIPITKDERDFRWTYGVNELENLFEKHQFNYLNPFRKSVVLK